MSPVSRISKLTRAGVVLVVTLGVAALAVARGPAAHADTIPLPQADPRAVAASNVIVGKPVYVILPAPGYQHAALETAAFGFRMADPLDGRNNTQLQLWPFVDTTVGKQYWLFDNTNVLGLYRVRNYDTGRCLDADNRFGGDNGTAVQSFDCRDGNQLNQFWWLVSDGSGRAELVNDWNGRCLDVDNRFGGANGSVLQLWDCLGSGQTNQWWNVIRWDFLFNPGP